MNIKQKVLLIILDGLGAAPCDKGNAVTLSDPQHLSAYWSTNPHTYLIASGNAVGLPKNVKGNSEVGHLNLGAGYTVHQNLPRINKAIENGMFFKNNTLTELLNHSLKYSSDIHLVGLLSDSEVHSHINHFKALIDFFSKANFPNNVYIHAMTDGRDTPTNVAMRHLNSMEMYCLERGVGTIATIIGRYYGMDRNKKWDRTQKAYYLLERNMGERYPTCQSAIDANYQNGITDEFINPCVIHQGHIKENDSVVMVNFRPDRALQLTEALIHPNFSAFERELIPNLFLASMTEYRKGFPAHVIFPKQYVTLPLGKIISSYQLRQLRIAETEKYPHVTYFFNGGTSHPFDMEDRILIPSPNVATYDLKPEMSALEVTNILLKKLDSNTYDFILVNLANTDMVGHTGNLEAAVKAVEVVDYCVHQLIKMATGRNYATIITADHGNIEEMINVNTGEINTEHTINPVPIMILGTKEQAKTLPYGSLKDVAPTVLDIMGIQQPSEMTGKSLLPL